MDIATLFLFDSYCHPNFTISSDNYYFCIKYMRSDYDLLFTKILMCFVNPSASVLGLIFNGMMLMVLRIDGLHKPPNILLLGMLIANTMGLCGALNFGLIILFFGPDRPYPQFIGLQYDHQLNYFLTYCFMIGHFIEMWGLFIMSWIPVIIMINVILAIFKPFQHAQYLTPRRAWAVVVTISLAWFPYMVFYILNFVIYEEPLTETRTYIGIRNVNFDFAVGYSSIIFLECTASFIPLTFITCGCVVILFKIRLVVLKRRHLSHSEKKSWSVRSTRTLLVTCIAFAIGGITIDVIYAMAGALLIYFYLALMLSSLAISFGSLTYFLVYMISNPKVATIFWTKMCHMLRKY